MRINNNMQAMNTNRQLGKVQTSQAKSMEKLSSGYRINRAGDDAAGLAISEKMRGQISGLDQASRNAQDGISMIQTAEGALSETQNILQRMRELSVQSATDTNTDDDRVEIQKEITQLTAEIDRISTDTEFNTKKLLDGSISNTAEVGGTNTANIVGASITDDSLAAGDYTLTVSGTSTVVIGNDSAGSTAIDSLTLTDGAGLAPGSYTIDVAQNSNGTTFDLTVNNAEGEAIGTLLDQASAITLGTDITIDGGGAVGFVNAAADLAVGTYSFDVEANATLSVTNSDGDVIGATTIADFTSSSVSVGGMDFELDSTLTDGADTTITVATDAVSFQIGANEGQQTSLSISDMSASGLKIDAIDLSTQDGASAAITTINDALTSVSSERSKLGAAQNRLEYTISNLDTSAENLQAAESRIRDVDMATEMMEFTKNNILSSAATSMLAQANQAPQSVLQLLQ